MTAQQKTVLVVDDDGDFREQMRLTLEGAGYAVHTAPGQAEAERLLETLRPDIAILDLMMENMDGGFVLSYKIKKAYPGVPVIMVTAVTSETGMVFDRTSPESRSWLRADAILAKPVRAEQLTREITRLLGA
jgi:CheY-like chemotaxis protein